MGKCKKEPAVLFTFNGDHRHITLVDEKISLKPTSRERHRNIALLGLECEELKSESATWALCWDGWMDSRSCSALLKQDMGLRVDKPNQEFEWKVSNRMIIAGTLLSFFQYMNSLDAWCTKVNTCELCHWGFIRWPRSCNIHKVLK